MNYTNLANSTLTKSNNRENIDTIAQNIAKYQLSNQKNNKDDRLTIQFQYMKLQQQYRRQLANSYEQIQNLKLIIKHNQLKIQQCQNKQFNQTQQLNSFHKQNLKLFNENQKNKKLVSQLKADNQSLQLQIQRSKSDRKTYAAKLDNIYDIKKNINMEMNQKNKVIEQQQIRIQQMQRQNCDMKIKLQELTQQLNQKQLENKDYANQIKNNLQTYFNNKELINKIKYQLSEASQNIHSLKEKVYLLEKDKETLMQRICQLKNEAQDHEDFVEQSRRSNQEEIAINSNDERLMMEIQSFMRQFENLMDKRDQQKHKRIQKTQKVINSIKILKNNI